LAIEQLEDRRVMAGFLQGFAFVDVNSDGQRDSGDLPKPNATIELRRQSDGFLSVVSAATDADGYYRFDGLPSDTYRITEIPPLGFGNSGVQLDNILSAASPVGLNTVQVVLEEPLDPDWDAPVPLTIHRLPGLPGAVSAFTLSSAPAVITAFSSQPNTTNAHQFQLFLSDGALPLGGDPSANFYSFCVDLFHILGPEYAVDPSLSPAAPGLTNNIDRIGYLYNTFGRSLLSPTDGTGLQLALYELIYDAAPDFNSGSFTVDQANTDGAAYAAALGYLAASVGKDQRAVFLNVTPPTPTGDRGRQGMIVTENFNFANKPVIIVGPDKSNRSLPFVHIVDATTGEFISSFLAYNIGYRGGVRVATGDITGDGIPEIITAPGRNLKPIVKVFSLDGTLLEEFLAYSATFKGGVDLAIGDINNDGQNDIITAMSFGGNQAKVFKNPNGTLTTDPSPFHAAYNFGTTTTVAKQLAAFSPFGTFKGGASVEVADLGTVVNGGKTKTLNTTLDGRPEIIVANEAGMRSTVYVYGFLPVLTAASQSGTAYRLRSYLPFTSAFRGGLSLSVAPVAHAGQDLIPDIIVGAASLGSSQVQILNGATTSTVVLSAFVAFSAADTPSYNAPVHVTALDEDGNGIAESILASQGSDGTFRRIRKFDTLTGALVDELLEADFDPAAVDHFFGAYFTAALKP